MSPLGFWRTDSWEYCRKIRDAAFLRGLVFLMEISFYLNRRNTSAAYREMYQDCMRSLHAFQRKLKLFRDGLPSVFPNLAHLTPPVKMFPSVRDCFQSTEPSETLQRGFEEERFQEFHTMQPRAAFFTGPFSDAVRTTRGVAAGPVECIESNERNRLTEESSSC